MAIFGSAACRLPQCLWSSPARVRTNTSHRGHSGRVVASVAVVMSIPCLAHVARRSCGELSLRLLGGVCHGRFANPRTVFPSLHACTQALAIAGAIAADDLPEFIPIDDAEVVVLAVLVPFQIGVGQGHA